MPTVRPFLKWPGGKRWFIQYHSSILPSSFNTYIEPFLGSGSVFFHLKPRRAILGDLNPELVASFQGIKDDWLEVERLLEGHEEAHTESYYYLLREQTLKINTQRAARLIYLNRTCFNGIFRVNRKGRFNVPVGTRDTIIFDDDNFNEMAQALEKAEIKESDFAPLINCATQNDFIFADPPYTVRHNINGFLKYNETLFSWSDQIRLADALSRARDRGAIIVSTNANHQSVRNLYQGRGFQMRTVSRFSPISADPDSRKQFEELVITT
ncbi:adenine-specific DNA-methyltransferase [Nitrospira sp. KM1]|uniref:DNA adenine methylase n=1 Tax=Nitrospira sp. KM1 TaxID=1936990 RepID=UPI0013A7998E|nr:Dam family site-specific DNA-(adenine-N6)-methyltransferase [Nitrospira sp. KM1]BCA53726.1 adenine-specific DNA-methyltransferase [Nitrospira sp. KM1]